MCTSLRKPNISPPHHSVRTRSCLKIHHVPGGAVAWTGSRSSLLGNPGASNSVKKIIFGTRHERQLVGQHKGFRRTRKKPRQPKLTGLPRYSSSTTSSRSIGRSLPFARAVPLTLAALRLGRSDLLLPAARPFFKERRHSSLTRVQSSSKHSSLEAVIDTEGKVENVKVLRFVEGFPSLTEAAIKALEQWRYLPAMENGRPVKTSLTVVMEFFPAPATPEGIEALERLARRAMPMSL